MNVWYLENAKLILSKCLKTTAAALTELQFVGSGQ